MDVADTTYLLNSFIESIARVTSYALTDQEKESVVRGFRQFHQRLERISSSTSLRQLAIESKKRQEDTAKCHHEDKTCPQNAIRGFIKAFVVGFAVKYGLDTAPHLVSLRLFARPSLLLRAISHDTLSFASFLSAVIGSYKAFLCAMRRIHGGKGNDYTNALVAGMLSGLIAIKLDRNRSRRAAITLYMVSRALQYGCVWLFNRWAARRQLKEDAVRGKAMKRAHSEVTMASPTGLSADLRMSAAGTRGGPVGRVKWSPETVDGSETKRETSGDAVTRHITRFVHNHAPTALLSVSVAVIVCTLVFHTDVIPRGYMSFLSRTAGYERFYPRKAPIALKTIAYDIRRSYATGNHLGSRVPLGMTTKEHMATIPIARDIIGALDDTIHHDYTACGIFHPKTSSCRIGMLSTALHCFPIALK
ncbi:hypothetical protein H4S07_005646, partial [Coemansia furcata]